MKQLYKTVNVEEIQGKDPQDKKFKITVEGKTLKTPKGISIVLKNRAIAKSIAKEWENIKQGERNIAQKMAMTQLVNTTFDKIIPNKAEICQKVISFAMNDLICYRCGNNAHLRKIQDDRWHTWLVWAKDSLDMPLRITRGVMPIAQHASVKSSATLFLRTLENFSLTVMAELTNVYGSFVLAAAVTKNHLDGMEAFDISRIDELYQMEKWGTDAEVQSRVEEQKQDLYKMIKFLQMVGKT